MQIRFEYQPIPIMEGFHASIAPDRLIVGGYGSGKSMAGCAEMQAWGLEEPGAEFLITRKTAPSLRDTTEKIFMDLLPPEFVKQCDVAKAGGHLEHVTFPNGTNYLFRGMDDWHKHRSMTLTGIFWDEADEFTLDDFQGMQSRLRQTRPLPGARAMGYTQRITRRGNVLAANPAGHNWFFKDFIDEPTRRRDTAYWISTSFDNPYLTRDFLERLLSMPDPWVRRYVLSSFDEFAGAIYPDWNFDDHIVEPYKNAVGAYVYDAGSWFRMGFDPGSGTINQLTGEVSGSLNAALWVYFDRKRNLLVGVAEYADANIAVTEHVKAWRRIEARHGMTVRDRIGDPNSVNNRDRGSNVKLSDLYARKGYHFQLGPSRPRDRVWALGELIATGRFKLTRECMKTFNQILNYRWEDLTPRQLEVGKEPAPLKKDVDLVDATQYAVSRYTPPAPLPVPDEDPEDRHAREIHAAIRENIRRKRTRNAKSSNPLGNVYR